MIASRDTFPLLAELLADQQRLDTPVARFSTAHDVGSAPQMAALRSQLLPLSQPGAGEQYAFEVDLDSCTGCKSCVAACHSLNGLDETETWRDVGLIVGASRAHPFTQTVTSACHHCADPACLNGCPVLAYEKDPVTGIVRHLDDQCIGCSYCVLKCPYDAPKYSSRLGIVRKCDMCHGRLAAGEAPACAQACPTQAIKIVTVPVAVTTAFLPTAPAPDYTQPTTRYLTRRRLPENLRAADAATPRSQPAHGPLVVMLTLIPAALGLSFAALFPPEGWNAVFTYYVKITAVGAGAIGLAASVFHLGQPLRAWRIFLGWRRSWLTREALAFGVWFGLACIGLVSDTAFRFSAAVGCLGLACSAMIYVDTRRHFWRAAQTFPRFVGTAAVVALACIAPAAAAFTLAAKLALEWRTYFDGSTSARVQRTHFAALGVARDVLGFTAIILLLGGAPGLALVPALLGEFTERYLYFRAVDAPKMPGVAA